MKWQVLAVTAILAMSGASRVYSQDLIDENCKLGVPWTLPSVAQGHSRAEVYLVLNGAPTTTVRICHCTEDGDDGPRHVWVVAKDQPGSRSSDDEPQAAAADGELVSHSGTAGGGGYGESILRGRGCLDATGSFIIVNHSDRETGRQGTYQRLK